MERQIIWDEETNQVSLTVKNKDGSISVTPITTEEAARIAAEDTYA